MLKTNVHVPLAAMWLVFSFVPAFLAPTDIYQPPEEDREYLVAQIYFFISIYDVMFYISLFASLFYAVRYHFVSVQTDYWSACLPLGTMFIIAAVMTASTEFRHHSVEYPLTECWRIFVLWCAYAGLVFIFGNIIMFFVCGRKCGKYITAQLCYYAAAVLCFVIGFGLHMDLIG